MWYIFVILQVNVDAFEPSDMSVDLNADSKVLTVTGEHKDASTSATMKRSFVLPDNAVLDAITSDFEVKADGGKKFLVVVVPKRRLEPQNAVGGQRSVRINIGGSK